MFPIHLIPLCLFFDTFVKPALSQSQPHSQSQSHTQPKIQLQLLSDNYSSVFEHLPFFSDRQYLDELLFVSYPIQFASEKTIYWNHNNNMMNESTATAGSVILEKAKPILIKFKLTCKAPYITKWKINNDQEEMESSFMSYRILPYSRDDENPLLTQNYAWHWQYNLTELEILWFGPKFRSGFIDCVRRLNESVRTRLNVFQRFDDSKRKEFDDSRSENLQLSPDSLIPCKVHDPDMIPKLERKMNLKLSNKWEDVSDIFTYNWKTGFKRTVRAKQHAVGYSYRCLLDKAVNVTYLFVAPTSPISPNTDKDIKNSDLNHLVQIEIISSPIQSQGQGQDRNESKFVCKLHNNSMTPAPMVKLTSIQLAPCLSPDYCYSNMNSATHTHGYGEFTLERDCTDLESERCEIVLPNGSSQDEDLSESIELDVQGRIWCNFEIDLKPRRIQRFYLTGLSGRIKLVSENVQVDEIAQLKITELDESPGGINISCTVINFLTFPSIQFSINYFNKTRRILRSGGSLYRNKHVHYKELTISPGLTDGAWQLSCHAPIFNSPTWRRVSQNLTLNYSRPIPYPTLVIRTETGEPDPDYFDKENVTAISPIEFTLTTEKAGLELPSIVTQTVEARSENNSGVFCHFRNFGLAGNSNAPIFRNIQKSIISLHFHVGATDVKEIGSSRFAPSQNWTEHWANHTEELSLTYYDGHVAVYIDRDVRSVTPSTFKPVSSAWLYITEKYGPLGSDSDPTLYVVLHTNKHESCQSSRRSSYIDHDFENRTVVDCGRLNGGWSWSSPSAAHILLVELGRIIPRLAKRTGKWPAFNISHWQIGDIFVYDIFTGIGMSKEATRWLQKKRKDRQNYPVEGEGTFWFRDWYFPIYTKYGETTVLNNYLELLSEHWPKNSDFGGYDYEESLNVGEFVHFWSGATGVNLKGMATKTFGGKWTEDHEVEFQHAMEDYRGVKYQSPAGVSTTSTTAAAPPTPPLPPPPAVVPPRGNDAQQDTFILILGVSLGFLCVLIAAVTIPLILYRRNIRSIREAILRELTAEEVRGFYEGISISAFSSQSDGYSFIQSQPFNKNYEIPRDRLEIAHNKILGSGEFGLVLQGTIKALPGNGPSPADRIVAVKTVKPNVDVTYFKALLTELKVMCYVGKHDNIACLLGAFTVNIRQREVYIALEYCENGDLHRFLKKHHAGFKDLLSSMNSTDSADASASGPVLDERVLENGASETQITSSYSNTDNTDNIDIAIEVETADTKLGNDYVFDSGSGSGTPGTGTGPGSSSTQSCVFSSLDLIEWSHQIANGMVFISSKKVIHGDLAARNILLTENNVAKISDFGLSRQLVNYSIYTKASKTPLPWRWMAVESLRDMKFSLESDVWAFGVTLFELFSLGITPYPDRTYNDEFIDRLLDGFRLKSPKFGNNDIYNLMMDCMRTEPSERLTFPEIFKKLQGIKNNLVTTAEAAATENRAKRDDLYLRLE